MNIVWYSTSTPPGIDSSICFSCSSIALNIKWGVYEHWNCSLNPQITSMSSTNTSLVRLLQNDTNGSFSFALSKLMRFTTLASVLRDNILLPQPGTSFDSSQPPQYLPQAVWMFLANACEISLEYTDICWDSMKGLIWTGMFRNQDNTGSFLKFGHPLRICQCHLIVAAHSSNLCTKISSAQFNLSSITLLHHEWLLPNRSRACIEQGRATPSCSLHVGQRGASCLVHLYCEGKDLIITNFINAQQAL